MLRMFHSEWIKLRKTVLWLVAGVGPAAAALAAGLGLTLNAGTGNAFPWLEALSIMAVLHGMLFLPLLTGVYAAVICRYEHTGGGWKQLLSLPVSRTQVYIVKLLCVAGLVAWTQALFLGVLLLVGAVKGAGGTIPWEMLLRSAAGGWVACLPLAALQLAVSAAWPSFAAPLAVNVIFTLPNMLVANSAAYAPYYPWAQPMLAMIPRETYTFGAFSLPPFTLFVVILGSFAVFFAAGWGYFARRAL